MEGLVNLPRVLATAGLLLALGTVAGWPLAAMLESHKRLRLYLASALGLPVLAIAAFMAFHMLPFKIGWLALFVLVFCAFLYRPKRQPTAALFDSAGAPGWVWPAVALVLAALPASAVYPQYFGASVGLPVPIFDHIKVAIVDEILRSGLPAHNPFYQEAGASNALVYYYLWYVLAALGGALTGATGWEAEIALTGVTAFSGLMLIGWLAIALARRTAAGWWAFAIAFCAQYQRVIDVMIGPWLTKALQPEGFLHWFGQASWVPQHLFSGQAAVLAVLMLVRALTASGQGFRPAVVAGALVAASFCSSSWIGGIGLAVLLPIISLILIADGRKTGDASSRLVRTLVAGLVALICAAPLLWQFIGVFGGRKVLGFWIFPVIAPDRSPASIAGNISAYWLLRLVLELSFAYAVTMIWIVSGRIRAVVEATPIRIALLLTILLLLILPEFFRSVVVSQNGAIISNNDFGWRIVIPPTIMMTSIAAAIAAHAFNGTNRFERNVVRTLCALVLIPSLVGAAMFARLLTMNSRVYGIENADSRHLRTSAELWSAVRQVTPRTEAVANNPLDLKGATAWPGNIGWALLSNRRNCGAAGYITLIAYAHTLSADAMRQTTDRFERIFAGAGTEDEVRAMRDRFMCRTVVVRPVDGLWTKGDALLRQYYALADERPDRWRIYRAR